MRTLLLALAALPTCIAAQTFETLGGAQIKTALTDRALIYTGGETQDFRASGATLYNAGRDSWGYWAVRGDQYCSQWPPGDQWDCYDVQSDGAMIRFVAPDGSVSTGTYSE